MSGYQAVALENVALLAEGVDRNDSPIYDKAEKNVALLAEGVDRNRLSGLMIMFLRVALLAEGVDRNSHHATREATTVSRPPRGGRG